MTMLEDQIATLLKTAPGEPPMTLDPDALLDTHSPRRGRLLAPLLVAAIVAGLAVIVAVATSRGGSSDPAKPSPTSSPPNPSPRAAAIVLVERGLADAALPPGARVATHPIQVGGATSGSGSRNEVRRHRVWTAPGTLHQAIAYIRVHPPAGLRASCVCGGPRPGPRWLFFRSDRNPLEIDYQLRAYQGGVALQVDAWTVWVPIRPTWSYIGGSLRSVDLTVVRDAVQPGYAGAPTVRRTLTGATATRLAAEFDALPAQAPFGAGPGGPSRPVLSTNKAVFHTERGDVIAIERSYSQLTVTSPTHPGAINLGGDLQGPVLSALGLPSDYGEH